MVSKVKAAPGGQRPQRSSVPFVLCGRTRADSTCQSSVTRHAPAFPQPPRSNRRGLMLAAESGGFARRRQSCEREFKLARPAQSTANVWSPDATRCRHLARRRFGTGMKCWKSQSRQRLFSRPDIWHSCPQQKRHVPAEPGLDATAFTESGSR